MSPHEVTEIPLGWVRRRTREPARTGPGAAHGITPAVEPIALRAHNLLCLLGFRGRGYDDRFVEAMTAVHARLRDGPSTPVRVLAQPDDLCSACPHLRGGCTLGGPEHEAHMRAQDLEVARRLGLRPGDVLPWRDVLERVAGRVRGADLPPICTTCPWLSLGWCAEGVEGLRPHPGECLPRVGAAGKAGAVGTSKDRSPPTVPPTSSPVPSPQPAPPGAPPAAPILPFPRAGATLRTDREGRLLPDRPQMDRWVARMRDGDEGALREVVAAFSERLTAVVAGLLHDRDAVDDVVQETFVKAWFRLRSFQGDAGLYTWLYRIAVNAAKDRAKATRRRPAGSLEDLPTGPASLPSDEGPSLEPLADRELRLAVRRAVHALPPKFRAVLVLRELEGLRYEEIAEILDLSLGTVESRLFRARRRLKALLATHGARP